MIWQQKTVGDLCLGISVELIGFPSRLRRVMKTSFALKEIRQMAR